MARKETVFQALDRAVRGDWGRNTVASPHVNTYNVSGNDVIYRTTDKDDYEQKKLELQQNEFLKNRWVKANVNLSVTAYAGLNNIKLMYRDADLMDAFPEIGAALDLVSEESVTPFPDNGQVVHISSKSERVKSILEDLFVNRLNLQLTAPMIIRAMCKYGNQFMLLNIDRKNGVLGWKQMPVFNVERIESGIQNPFGAGASLAVNGVNVDKADLSTQFVWLDDNNSQIPFREWQIAHFRLLTNSLYLPYGCSYLNSARRHWRILSLLEDMMLIYRLERSVERRVYKIYVGAIDDADVPAYMESIANEFKRTPIIDPMTGQVDLRKNILPVHKDTPIPLLDGRTITIEELAKEFESGKENYVYSIQDKSLQIVPGKVVWCGKNYTADKLLKITLDDDTYMTLAPEHEIVMRDGTKKRADNVVVGESVMPLYRKSKLITSKSHLDYETVYNPNSGQYEFTHRLVGANIVKTADKTVIHHKDFNHYNNAPSNLQWMGWNEHKVYHCSLNSSERIRKIRSECSRKRDYVSSFREYNNSELHKKHDIIRCQAASESWKGKGRENRIAKIKTKFDDEFWAQLDKAICENVIYNRQTLLDFINTKLIEHLLKTNPDNTKLHHNVSISRRSIEAELHNKGFETITQYLEYVAQKDGAKLPSEIIKEKKRQTAYSNGFHKYGLWSDEEKEKRKCHRGENQYDNTPVVFDDHIWQDLRSKIIDRVIRTTSELIDYINTHCIDYLLEHNSNTVLHSRKSISKTALYWQIKEKYDLPTGQYIQAMRKNHKIKDIEWVNGDDVYCMTVVGLNGEEDRHNFALCSINQDGSWCRNGVFVSNCASDDLFVPVRDPATPSPVETLPAGQNLTAIDDIKFIQNKVLTALRIPKTFLNFEENVGDGKNLALMDIRFTRVINRIQQAFLMELTRVASIHLFLLGFDDDLTNFTLSMNNPSTQAEQLEIENMQKKIDAIRDAVSDPGNGLPVMSQMRALREILKWSDKQIKENLEEIRLEKGVAAELEKTTQIIKKTGIFDNVDRIYGEPGAEYIDDQQGSQGGMDNGGGMGGGPSGGGMTPPPMDNGSGSELDNMDSSMNADDNGTINGEEGSVPTQDMPTDNTPMESALKRKPLLTESSTLDKLFDKYLSTLNEHNSHLNETKVERVKAYDDDALLINEDFDKMINALGKFVNDETEEQN